MNRVNKRTRYDESFKANAVKLVIEGNQSLRQTSLHLGMGKSTLDKWVRNHRAKTETDGDGLTESAQKTEIKRLKRALLLAEMERDILKKAVGIFSNQSS